MSTICVHSENQPGKEARYRAVAGDRQVYGATMGQALDALAADWGGDIQETVVLIQRVQPDEYFTAAQQQRKRELMARSKKLSPAERQELESLLDAELDATVARTDRLVR